MKKGSLTQKIHWLKQTLILSCVLNVIFIGIFFYFLVRENPFPLAFEYPPSLIQTEETALPTDVFRSFASLSLEELREKLKDDHLIQEGYRIRDISLCVLGYRDKIDVQRALGKKNLSERCWKVTPKHEVYLYPGLTTEDFSKIEKFLCEEMWPQTSFGLYCLIQKQGAAVEPSLLQAFCVTPEFVAVQVLFGRAGLPIKKGTLLKLMCEAGWEAIASHLQVQQEGCHFSEERRQKFLCQALEAHSKTAAYLLLITDYPFASKQLDDPHVALLLGLLSQKTKEAVRFAKEMAASIRSDSVRERASKVLAIYGEEKEEPVALRPGPRAAIGELRPVFRDPPPASPPSGTHIIQDGESLWLIARKYKVSIEDLMAINKLSSPTIRPGKTLKIP